MQKQLIFIILGISATIYISVCLLLRFGQSKLIFVPDRQLRSTPAKYQLDYQDVWIDIESEQIHGWWIPSPQESAPVILYFHGNASNNGDVVDNAAIFHRLGLSVLLIDYRGYGKSSPTPPNETKAYQDAAAAWQYLTKTRQILPQKIFVYGHSLGGAIAIELATRHPEMAGLIVEGTFTSIEEMASLNPFFKILPLSLLVTERFDSIDKISSLQTPLLMFHGTDDEIIPLKIGKKLFENAPKPKKLVLIDQAEHNNLHRVGDSEYILNLKQFINEQLTIKN